MRVGVLLLAGAALWMAGKDAYENSDVVDRSVGIEYSVGCGSGYGTGKLPLGRDDALGMGGDVYCRRGSLDADAYLAVAWDWSWAEPTATATLLAPAGLRGPEQYDGGAPLPEVPAPTSTGLQRQDDVELRSLICGAPYTWACAWALATIACESGGDPNAVGSEWYQGELWYFVGLWQIATRDPAMIPTLQDPVTNTLEAHWKYTHGGASHWPVCGR